MGARPTAKSAAGPVEARLCALFIVNLPLKHRAKWPAADALNLQALKGGYLPTNQPAKANARIAGCAAGRRWRDPSRRERLPLADKSTTGQDDAAISFMALTPEPGNSNSLILKLLRRIEA